MQGTFLLRWEAQGTVHASLRWPSGLKQSSRRIPVNHRIAFQERLRRFSGQTLCDLHLLRMRGGEPAESRTLPSSAETCLIEPLRRAGFPLPDLAGKCVFASGPRQPHCFSAFWHGFAVCRNNCELLPAIHCTLTAAALRSSHKLR